MANGVKKKVILTLIIFMNLLVFYDAKNQPKENEVKKKSFRNGEELIYTMSYGFIHGGNASITLKLDEFDNKTVYHARAVAKSIGITNKIYKIEDIYESFFDTLTCLPYKSVRNISEGGYKDYNEVYFAHEDCTLFSQKSGMYKVPPDILDVVSSLFYLRNMNIDTLKNGDILRFLTFFGDEIFPFPLRYRGKENVKTKFGKFQCHRFDPVVEVGRVFKSEDDMTLWITADQNLIPLRVRLDMIVGAVYCDLVSYKNIVDDLRPLEHVK
jgi:hypothetical protein